MKINEVLTHLKDVYLDWFPFIANPLYMRDGSCITWTNRVPRMLDAPVMASEVASLVEDQQYTFQIYDGGSVFQLYYNFDERGNNLQSARLAFYHANADGLRFTKYNSSTDSGLSNNPNIENRFGTLDNDNTVNMFDKSNIGETDGGIFDEPVNWLRIEYDPENAKGILHYDCHMHLSAFPHSRLPVAGVPNPRQFIEFVMALCYPNLYEQHRLNEEGQYKTESNIVSVNSKCFPLAENKVFSQIAHFRIPFTN